MDHPKSRRSSYQIENYHHHNKQLSSKTSSSSSSVLLTSLSQPSLSFGPATSNDAPRCRLNNYPRTKSMDHDVDTDSMATSASTTTTMIKPSAAASSSRFLRFNYPHLLHTSSSSSSYDLIKSSSLLDRSYPNLSALKHFHPNNNNNNNNHNQPQQHIQQNGRLDLSFTKCRFPNDYLPYATTTHNDGKKRSNSINVIGCDGHHHDQDHHHHFTDDHHYPHHRTSSDSAFDEPTTNTATTSATNSTSTVNRDDMDNNQQQQQQSTTIKMINHDQSSTSPQPSSTSSSLMFEDNHHNHNHNHNHHHQRRKPFLTYPFYPISSGSCSDSSQGCANKSYRLIKSCGCCLMIMLAILILLSLSIVLGFSLYLAIVTNLLAESTFAYSIGANFKIVSGDNFTIRLLNQTSTEFRRKAGRYEKIINNVLHGSLISDSILHSEIYTFRQGSLIVFFRIYASKTTFDQLLAIKKSKTIINFGTIENIFLEDDVIIARVRQILHDAFQHWTLKWNDPKLQIDSATVKVSAFERLTEPQYLDRLRQRRRYDGDDDDGDPINSIQQQYGTTTTTTSSAFSMDNDHDHLDDHYDDDGDGDGGQEWTQNLTSSILSSITKPTTTTKTTTTISTATINSTATNKISSNNNNNTSTAASIKSLEMDTNNNNNNDNKINNLDLNNKDDTNDDDGDGNGDAISKHDFDSSRFDASYDSGHIFGGILLRDLADLVWFRLNNNNNNNSDNQSQAPPIISGNDLDEQPVEPREEPDDDDDGGDGGYLDYAVLFNDTSVGGNPSTTFALPTTTLAPPSTTIAANNKSIDGFLINDAPPKTTTVSSIATATIVSLSNGTGGLLSPPTTADTPTTTKILLVSEDSFDLYSLGDSNSTSLSIEDDEVENEFQLNPSTPTMPPSSSSVPTLDGDDDDDADRTIVIIENEFMQPVIPTTKRPLLKNTMNITTTITTTTTIVPTILAYGTRLSKKLLNHHHSNKYHPSSHENSLRDHYNYYNPIINNKVMPKLPLTTTSTMTTKATKATTTTTTTTSKPPPMFQCEYNEFRCNQTDKCVPFKSICDRIFDCQDGSDELQCRCADYLLQDETHRHKLCDGNIDCADLSDETINCPSCREGMFVCIGPTNQCIDMVKVCDGENDCINGDDEQNCIALMAETDPGGSTRSSSSLKQNSLVQNHNPKGLLYIQHHGQWAPLCFDSYDMDSENWIDHYDNDTGSTASTSISISSMIQIDDMGQAVCRANYFSHLEKIEILPMPNPVGTEFFAISSKLSIISKPTLSLWSNLFEKVPCKEHKVARIECSSIECGIKPISSKLQRRIIGGQSSSFGSWPWQVALYREGEFQCGAVVIDSQWLLTAAHCFYSTPGAYWTARSGVLRRGSLHRTFHEEIRRIERVFIHPEYVDKGFLNDIAMLRLDKPLQYSKHVRPICLPDEEDSHIAKWNNQLCTTVGWGKLYEHGRIFPDTLQEVKLPIISTEECRKRTLFLPLYKITDNMFCAGFEHGGRDACLGDSGGPMMCQKSNGKWILLGITSNGDGCGRAGRPGVYTKVFNYLTWIRSIIVEGRSGRGMESDLLLSNAHQQNQWQQNQGEDNDSKNQTKKTSTSTTTTTMMMMITDKCNGHRCPLGKCLKPEQICNHIIDCEEDSSDEIRCDAKNSTGTSF